MNIFQNISLNDQTLEKTTDGNLKKILKEKNLPIYKDKILEIRDEILKKINSDKKVPEIDDEVDNYPRVQPLVQEDKINSNEVSKKQQQIDINTNDFFANV